MTKRNMGDLHLQALTANPAELRVVLEKMIELAKHYDPEKGRLNTQRLPDLTSGALTKREGAKARGPRTKRGVDAPRPETALVDSGHLTAPAANPSIQPAQEVKKADPHEAPPATMYASGVAEVMAKVEAEAPATKVDLSRLRKRQRLDTPTSPAALNEGEVAVNGATPVESSTDDSGQADISDPPPTEDPIAPVLGALGEKTAQNLSKKRQRRKAVDESTRKSVIASK